MPIWLALFAAKAARLVSRLTGHGGSSLPGRVARRLHPPVLRRLASQPRQGNVLVTGTNGKTTTAGLISAMAGQAGLSLVHNDSGANLISGVTAAFVCAAGPGGQLSQDLGLLEVDEATIPLAVAETAPAALTVTNLFPDQLDRFGTVAGAAAQLRRGIGLLPAGATLVLNADDPAVAALASAHPGPAVYFGVSPDLGPAVRAWQGSGASGGAAQPCGRCGQPLRYAERFYGHLGCYTCPDCGWGRPRPDVLLTGWLPLPSGGSHLEVVWPDGQGAGPRRLAARLHLPGFYNVGNALAALATGAALGWPAAALAAGLRGYQAGFGRMEQRTLDGREVRVALVKNPAGCDEVLRTLLHDPRPKALLFVLNDHPGDGADISWVWEAHLEWLAADGHGPSQVVCAGTRAAEIAVRLRYGGMDPARLQMEESPGPALRKALRLARPDGVLYILPTYSAMLELRPWLTRRQSGAAGGGA